jgi:putative transposase
MRYVDQNPVRARLTAAAWDWPWSSARVHAWVGFPDAVVSRDWVERVGQWNHDEWREILAASGDETSDDAIRRATRTGEPLGTGEFIALLERHAGKRLRVLERGRPKRATQSDEQVERQCVLSLTGIE